MSCLKESEGHGFTVDVRRLLPGQDVPERIVRFLVR
jgi:hypothetical protein